MPRLIDDVISGQVQLQPPRWIIEGSPIIWTKANNEMLRRAWIKDTLRDATVIDISNVAEYFWNGTDQEKWDVDQDFPCPMPPFGNIWMEFSRPSGVKTTRQNVDLFQFNAKMPKRAGIHCVQTLGQSAEAIRFSGQYVGKRYTGYHGKRFFDRVISNEILKAHSIIVMNSFICWHNELLVGPTIRLVYWLSDSGDVIDFNWNHEIPEGASGPTKEQSAGLDNYIYPGMLALSMINCKNVVFTDHIPERKLNKAYQRRHEGLSLLRFKRIVIEAVTKVAGSQGQPGGTGIKQALSICRGHFVHSGIVGPGGHMRGKLFGSLTGRFWVAQHARGNSELGTIVKDYAVKSNK
jgi:hypothetical protein